MSAVTIPPELAREVAEHPERFRPDISRPQKVLVLAGEASVYSRVLPYEAGPWPLGIAVTSDENGSFGRATAWALVGSVDGGPRPEVGGRVLALLAPTVWVEGRIGVCVRADYEALPGSILARFVDPQDGRHADLSVQEWALLPPTPAPEPAASDAQRDAEALAEHILDTHGRAAAWEPAASDAPGRAGGADSPAGAALDGRGEAGASAGRTAAPPALGFCPRCGDIVGLAHGRPECDAAYARRYAAASGAGVDALTRERDALAAEIARLTAEVDRVRDVARRACDLAQAAVDAEWPGGGAFHYGSGGAEVYELRAEIDAAPGAGEGS